MSPAGDPPRPAVGRSRSHVDRIVDLLFVLADDPAPRSVRQLSELVDCPRSAVHRMLVGLCARGLVERVKSPDGYTLGVGVMRLSISARDWMTCSMPHLERLRRDTGETSCLHALIDGARVTIAQSTSDHELRFEAALGVPYPVSIGAAGRALLAALEPDALAMLISRLDEPTASSVTAFRDEGELDRIREAGFALSRGERVKGGVGVAVPVPRMDAFEGPEGALAVSLYVPELRADESLVAGWVVALKDAALAIGSCKPD